MSGDGTQLGQARPAQHGSLAEKLKATQLGGVLPPKVATPRPEKTVRPVEEAPVETAGEATAPEVAAESSAAPAAQSKPKADRSRSRKEATVPPATQTTTDTESHGKADRPVQISLPRSINNRLEAYKKSTGLSHPTILFNAIEATVDRLPELVKSRTVQVGGSSTKSLFNRPQTVVPRSDEAEPRESFIIRISQDNKDVLEQLAADTGAPNRNVLLVVAYDAFLPN